MKQIFWGVAGLFLFTGVTSCSDFLDEEPKENITLGQYYKTAEQARAAVNTMYTNIGFNWLYRDWGHFTNSRVAYTGSISGFFDNEVKGQEIVFMHSQALDLNELNVDSRMTDVWSNMYQAIGRANSAIKYVPLIEDSSFGTGEKDELLAQAKFFRAMAYFTLVKWYGDVCLTIEPYESLDDIYLQRSPSSDIYDLIVSDLQAAVNVLPDTAFATGGYRVTKNVAESFLASVYLQMSGYPLQANNYAAAATAAKNVISRGRHTLTAHGADTGENSAYNRLRMDESLPEYIYSIERSNSVPGYEAGYHRSGFPRTASGWGFAYSEVCLTNRPVVELIRVYDPENDLRVAEKQFFWTEYTAPSGTTYKLHEEIGLKEGEAYAPWFYYDAEAMLVTGRGAKDYPVMRYPEVLLIAAEAIAQSEGVTAEAVGYLADVRARAYTQMTKEQIVSSLSGLSKEDFIEEVWTERVREFPLENKLWDDIQRTRKYPTTSAANVGVVTWVDVIGARNPWGSTFQEHHLLWPISWTVLQRTPGMEQNPGYSVQNK